MISIIVVYYSVYMFQIALLLKRGLLQQGEVRSDIYDRMSVILTDNYTIRHMIIQQLEESLSKVYEDHTGTQCLVQ